MFYRRDRKRNSNSATREWAGVIAALIAVVAFINYGYVLILIEVFFDKKVSANEAWSSGLISLSSAALGFLIGKQTTAVPSSSDTTISAPTPPAAPLSPVAITCNIPGCPYNKETPPYESN